MRRFFCGENLRSGDHFEIKGELFHHIVEVCRFRVGDQVELIDSKGCAHLAEILTLSRRSGFVNLMSVRELPKLQTPFIHLVVGFPKFSTLEMIVEKSVEIGVCSVWPVFSDFSFIRSAAKVSEAKWSRWEKIIRSAVQQSGAGHQLDLKAPVALREAFQEINQGAENLCLFPYEGAAGLPVREALSQRDELVGSPPQHIWAFVGSEGGFSEEEVTFFNQQAVPSVTLGSQILRVETACLSLVSILKYHYGLWS